MRDLDIRSALRRHLGRVHRHELGTLIIDELGLCSGTARVDMAVVNGSVNGYEIKSELDTLERLPSQQEIYNKTLDSVTIVASGPHLAKIEEMVPAWWGIRQAVAVDDGIQLDMIRPPGTNPAVDPLSIAQFLWRDEVLAALQALGLDEGMRSKPRRLLWRKLVESIGLDELRDLVRNYLKARENWRSGRSQTPDGAMCQPCAK